MHAKSLSLDWQDWLERWDKQQSGYVVEPHEVALRHAGFRAVGVLWQNLDSRILMAVC